MSKQLGTGLSLSSDIVSVREQIVKWRAERTGHSAMPQELWQAAVTLAKRYGVHKVATGLRISYGCLKKRVLGKPAMSKNKSVGFVEVAAPVNFGASFLGGAQIEIRRPDGASARIYNVNERGIREFTSAFLNEAK